MPPVRDVARAIRSVAVRYLLPIAVASAWSRSSASRTSTTSSSGWFRSDVQMRAQLVMTSIDEPLARAAGPGATSRGRSAYLERVAGDERLLGIVVCDADGR